MVFYQQMPSTFGIFNNGVGNGVMLPNSGQCCRQLFLRSDILWVITVYNKVWDIEDLLEAELQTK